ncbi:MAG: hypothetical protein HQM04_18210 [Magnetococcales bacterium]|nr:hypothetical protein [Magnetococcales bacterium]MBF0116962.1 hypothetical protein [Magnetococcales bacterium]
MAFATLGHRESFGYQRRTESLGAFMVTLKNFIGCSRLLWAVVALLLFMGTGSGGWLAVCLDSSGKRHLEIELDVGSLPFGAHSGGSLVQHGTPSANVALNIGDHQQPHRHFFFSDHFVQRDIRESKTQAKGSNVLPRQMAVITSVPQYILLASIHLLAVPSLSHNQSIDFLRTVVFLI